MVQSKPLRPEWLPAVALSSALALLMLVWSPPVGDLAAQVFRTELFEQAGLAIWNGSWYGGHYTLTYSVLFPPLAALLGPAGGGGARGRLLLLPLRPPRPRPLGGGGALGDPLVRRRGGDAARRRPAHLRARGRLRPRLAALPADRPRPRSALPPPRPARWPARSPPSSSPASSSPARSSRAAASAAPRSRSPASRSPSPSSPTSPSPSRGQFPFDFSSYVAIPLWCGGALFVIRGLPEERQLRRVLVGYVLAATADLAGRRTRWAATRSASAPSSAARCWPRWCSRAGRRVGALVPRPRAWPAASTGS